MNTYGATMRMLLGPALLIMLFAIAATLHAQVTDTLVLRGRAQTLRLYGIRGSGDPVIVSSGDGGWIHLGPHVAEVLAAKGVFVVGFDVKRYLESFTAGSSTLRPEEEPGDFRTLIAYAARGSDRKPILIGVSEGAGLSVLAAADAETKKQIGGVIGLGLPDMNELGWRWRDALIYLTHRSPNEPTFTAAAVIGNVAPLPLAAIHSTNDEFVPLSEVQRTILAANEPKKLWIIKASDHRFSNNLAEFDQRLLEAITWLKDHQPD